MAWVKIENNIVIQKQPYQEDGFVEVSDDVICGMEQVGNNFYTPPKTFDVAIKNLRLDRNNLLAQTDYLALSDQTMTAEMTTYRQALRDITNGLTTVADVEAVVFPERPEV